MNRGKKLRIKKCLCSILVIISITQFGHGQESGIDTLNSKKLGLGADIFKHFLSNNGIEYDTLLGNVKITQDSFFLFCERAYVQDKSNVEALDNISILHGDSIEIFSDSLLFNDREKMAHLFGEVIFVKNERKLFTSEAKYDINKKRAFYSNGATLFNAGATLISDKGVYDINANRALFEGRVSVRDSTSILKTDSLRYDLEKEVIYIIAPTNILTDSSEIYCEGGFYNYQSEIGRFYNNLQIQTGDRTILADRVVYYAKLNKYILSGYPVVNSENSHAQADTIIYYDDSNEVELIGRAYYKDEERELKAYRIDYNLTNDTYRTVGASEVIDEQGRILMADKLYSQENGDNIAESNVNLEDVKEATTLKADVLISDQASGRFISYNNKDQPLLIKSFEDDSLFLKCDTLIYNSSDTLNAYYGKKNVRYLKGDISGRAENLEYIPDDSIYIFSGDPIIWSDSIQITGDSLLIQMSDDKIESLHVIGNAFMIMLGAEGSYDQVKGDQIINYFDNNELIKVDVEGNVEMVYFMYENNKLEGVNHSLCGGLSFYFINDELDHLNFKDKPSSTFTKGETTDVESHNLQGFVWSIKKKPNKKGFVK